MIQDLQSRQRCDIQQYSYNELPMPDLRYTRQIEASAEIHL